MLVPVVLFIMHLVFYHNGKKVKKVDKIKFLGVIIDDQLSWNDQIEHVENKLLSTKFIPPSQYMKIYHSLFESHLTYGISCWGGSYKSKLQKIFCLQKICIRIIFGRTYSFDHHEFYYSCAHTKTYTEHMAQKDVNLEHTKPLFVKNNLLAIHNLYIIRSLNELLKIVKFHYPISLFTFFKFTSRDSLFRLPVPRIKLEISKRNYINNAIKLWNTCIGKILEPSILSVQPLSVGYQYILSGNTINSDMTIPIGLFKKKLNKLLLEIQKEGSPCEWENFNTMVT